MEICVNGDFRKLDAPAVLARDGGFLYGEAVYEGVKIASRRPLFLPQHLERLAQSAAALGLVVPWDTEEVSPIFSRLLDRAGADTALARLYVSAGVERPAWFVWVEPLPDYSRPDTPPWSLVCHDERVHPYLPGVKHANRLPHVRARRRARALGADDGLLVHREGWVLEGAQSNLFFVVDGVIHTPEIGCGLLAGITRDAILTIAGDAGVEIEEGRYSVDEVLEAEEWFLTFTSAGVKPVAAIEEVVRHAPGRVTSALRDRYEALVAEALRSVPPV